MKKNISGVGQLTSALLVIIRIHLLVSQTVLLCEIVDTHMWGGQQNLG